MQARRVGDSALLVLCADLDEVRATYARALAEVEAVDVVPAAATVLLDGLADVAATLATVGAWPSGGAAPAPQGPVVELPTTYDGVDLADVARRWGVPAEEVARRHAATEHVVAFCGFAPGFAYCTGLPDQLAVPRLDAPRPRVPAGAVGLAGGFTGVYPRASPGGWRLIGRTDAELWRPDRDPPALLAPGTRVRFVPVDGPPS